MAELRIVAHKKMEVKVISVVNFAIDSAKKSFFVGSVTQVSASWSIRAPIVVLYSP